MERWRRRKEGRERTSRLERERTEKRRDERGSGKRREDKVTGTGMVMAISED